MWPGVRFSRSISCSKVICFQFSFFFLGSVFVFLSYFLPFLSMLCFLYFPLSVSSSFTFSFVTFGVRTLTSESLFRLDFSLIFEYLSVLFFLYFPKYQKKNIMDLLNSESYFKKREISTSKILIQFSLVK